MSTEVAQSPWKKDGSPSPASLRTTDGKQWFSKVEPQTPEGSQDPFRVRSIWGTSLWVRVYLEIQGTQVPYLTGKLKIPHATPQSLCTATSEDSLLCRPSVTMTDTTWRNEDLTCCNRDPVQPNKFKNKTIFSYYHDIIYLFHNVDIGSKNGKAMVAKTAGASAQIKVAIPSCPGSHCILSSLYSFLTHSL